MTFRVTIEEVKTRDKSYPEYEQIYQQRFEDLDVERIVADLNRLDEWKDSSDPMSARVNVLSSEKA